MHCPRCGAEALTGQQFCRSCGFNLEKVAELVAEQPASTGDANLARLHDKHRKLERWSGIAGLATFEVILLTLIYVVVHQMIMKPGMIIPALLLIVLALGANVMAVLQVYAKSLKQELASRPQVAPSGLLESEARRQLAPGAQPAQSVTDHTTELLPVQHWVDTSEI